MVAQKKKQMIPQLRFAEFDGEWEENRLDETFSIINGYAFSSSDSTNEGAKWVKIADVGINEMKQDSLSFLPIDYIKQHKKFLLKEGDFVVALTRPILQGRLKIARINNVFNDSLLNQRVGKLKSSNNLEFIYSILQKESLISRIDNRIAGTDPPNLSPLEIGSLKIYIPKIPEQQKIAIFLTAVDKKLQQLTTKKEQLEHYKKGVMQQLFSQQLRFKDDDGNNFPDWEEKRLGEICEITMGQSPDSTSYNENGKGVLLIQGNADIKNRKAEPRQWTTEPTKMCTSGDLIMTVRAPVGYIAKTLHEACIGRGVCRINNNSKSIQEFLFQFLLNFEAKWIRLEQGSTFTAVSGNDIKTLKIGIPCKKEQQKIAAYLSALDAKIETVAGQLVKTQKFKKGLLQRLFV